MSARIQQLRQDGFMATESVARDFRFATAKSKIKLWLSPVAKFCQASFLKMTMLDGKPGLTIGDFEIVAGWCLKISRQDIGKSEKQSAIVELVMTVFGDRIPAWTVNILVWLAYQYLKRLGVL
jgi:hypothetical protein